VSLRLKIFLCSLLSALIVAIGSTYIFSNAWVDLARAYGILSIQERLNYSSSESSFSNEGEWAVVLPYSSTDSQTPPQWIRKPQGIPESSLGPLEQALRDNISRTNLLSGSFELKLKMRDSETPYFVVFKSGTRVGEENLVTVAGTQDQLGLLELTPFAAPFLGFVILALALSALASFGISYILNSSYTLLERALEDIGAGRFTKLKLPKSSDVAVKRITRALQSMASALEQKEDEIAKVSAMALEDPMTKIPNFRAFNDYTDKLLPVLAKNMASGKSSLLVIIDLDFFKKVNDTHGHQVGDFVLIEAAKIIKKNVREHNPRSPDRSVDFYARYGGEEFVAIFNDVDVEHFHVGPHRVLKAIKAAELPVPANISNDGKSFTMKLSASMGVAFYDPKKHKDKDTWIKEADDALYVAKETGRGRVCSISPEKKSWT
jgi:diguanylate cyclase (GGDEF)-like protein